MQLLSNQKYMKFFYKRLLLIMLKKNIKDIKLIMQEQTKM